MVKITDIEGLAGDPSTDAPIARIRCKYCGKVFLPRAKKTTRRKMGADPESIVKIVCPHCGKSLQPEKQSIVG